MQNLQVNRYLRLRAVRSGSGGLDLNAGRSNLSHRKWIRRPGSNGRAVRRRDTPEQGSAAAGSPETPNPALRGLFGMGFGRGAPLRHG